jgi:hypothetical protein
MKTKVLTFDFVPGYFYQGAVHHQTIVSVAPTKRQHIRLLLVLFGSLLCSFVRLAPHGGGLAYFDNLHVNLYVLRDKVPSGLKTLPISHGRSYTA